MSEARGKDRDERLQGLLGALLLPGLGRERLHDHAVRLVLVVARHCATDLSSSFLLHDDSDDVLVRLVKLHELGHEFLIDLVDPLGDFVLVPHGVLEHFFGHFGDFQVDVFAGERVVVLELVHFFSHFKFQL